MFRKHYNLNLFDSATSAKKKMRDFRRGYLIYKKNDEIYLFRKIKGLLNQKKIYFDELFLNLLLKLEFGQKLPEVTHLLLLLLMMN